MTMNASFPDWYRSAQMVPDAAVLQHRWAAIEALAEKPSNDLLIALLRLYTVPTSTEADCPADFRQAFKDKDSAFPAKDNLQEMRVLAGAVLRTVIDSAKGSTATSPADVSALGLLAASFMDRVSKLTERDHLQAAGEYIMRRSKALRASADPPKLQNSAFPRERYNAHLQAILTANGGLNTLPDPLFNALNELHASLAGPIKALVQTVTHLKHVAQVQDEELGILWWLQSGYCRSLAQPFSAVPATTGSLTLATELWDLTQFTPGPPYASTVLLQAMRASGTDPVASTSTLADAINATSRTWREELNKRLDLSKAGTLCPLLYAIKTSLATDSDDTWLPVYRKACDLALTSVSPLAEVALQLYRELSFLQSVEGA